MVALNAFGSGAIAAPAGGNFEVGAFMLALAAGLSGATDSFLRYQKAKVPNLA